MHADLIVSPERERERNLRHVYSSWQGSVQFAGAAVANERSNVVLSGSASAAVEDEENQAKDEPSFAKKYRCYRIRNGTNLKPKYTPNIAVTPAK